MEGEGYCFYSDLNPKEKDEAIQKLLDYLKFHVEKVYNWQTERYEIEIVKDEEQ